VILSENVIKGLIPQMDEWGLLRTMRIVLICLALVVLAIALGSDATIYKLVVNTYKVTLVAAFVPLAAGLFWKRATTQGALCAIAAGLVAWIGSESLSTEASVWPPQLIGLLMATVGMILGSQLSCRRT
jgi:solute:Na+ symporter, SSS family